MMLKAVTKAYITTIRILMFGKRCDALSQNYISSLVTFFEILEQSYFEDLMLLCPTTLIFQHAIVC